MAAPVLGSIKNNQDLVSNLMGIAEYWKAVGHLLLAPFGQTISPF